MRTDEFPFLTDWVAISFRWLAIIALAVSLTVAGLWVIPEYLIILLLCIWNMVLTPMAMLNKRMKGHRGISIAIDCVSCILLYHMTRGFAGPTVWVGILSLFSAAVYFSWIGIIVAVVGNSLFLVGWEIIFANLQEIQFSLISLLIGYVFSGVILFFFSRELLNQTRNIYRKKVSTRIEMMNSSRDIERKKMKAFFELVEMLSGSLVFNEVLDTALELCENIQLSDQKTGNPARLICAFLLFSENNLHIASSRGFAPRDSRITLPGKEGAIADSLKHGDLILVKNPGIDPELKQMLAIQRCDQILCMPLVRSFDVFGVLIIGSTGEKFFTQEKIDLFELISHQVTIALQNARLFNDLEVEKQHIIQTQEEIRKELARELHDGPTQTVSAIAMRSSVAKQLLDFDLEEARKELNNIENMARSTTKEIRHMLFTLRPLVLESEGLQAAFLAMADKMRDTFSQEVVINTNPEVINLLEASKQTVIFYIAEEAVNNARKHAKAEKITVNLGFMAQDKRLAILEILDNGVGFEMTDITNQYENRGSLGLVNLKERTDLINGILRIDSKPGHGTRVRVYIPLTKDAIDILQQKKGAKENLPALRRKINGKHDQEYA